MNLLVSTTSSNPLNALMKVFFMEDFVLGTVFYVVVDAFEFPKYIAACVGELVNFSFCSFLLSTS